MSPRPIHAATAALPGLSPRAALKEISQGLKEPLWGVLSAAQVQLCPQTPGYLSEENCESLKETFPQTKLRLHANARVLPQHQLWDASQFSTETQFYFQTLSERSKRLDAPAYSLHAGFRAYASLDKMFDQVRHIQDLFGDIPVAVEGLYPSKKMPQLIESWSEYEALLNSGLYMAIDMSHLNIVAQKEGWDDDVVKALLSSQKCLEVHLSTNDGHADQHRVATTPPSWLHYLDATHEGAVFFSEGDQYRFQRLTSRQTP